MPSKPSTVLVTGGAGYIGSHVSLALANAGYDVVIVDNLQSGHEWAVLKGRLVTANIADKAALTAVFEEHRPSAVLHFAGSIIAPESVVKPLLYYDNNVRAMLSLLEVCAEQQLERIVFSSSAAVYGNPPKSPITEDMPMAPVSPYGATKMIGEQMIADLAVASDLRYAFLRYFNVAGAEADARIGESHEPETHLIPLVIHAAMGKRKEITVYGEDYPTPDGTCIRDYIHVVDLAEAHVAALRYLEAGSPSTALNCGYGHGYSVLEIIEAVRKVTGVDFTVRKGERRPGDPAELVAANDRIIRELGWQPQHDDIGYIVKTSLAWERKRDAMISGQSAAE